VGFLSRESRVSDFGALSTMENVSSRGIFQFRSTISSNRLETIGTGGLVWGSEVGFLSRDSRVNSVLSLPTAENVSRCKMF
jgi:hypothetical protein